ncbi:monovalent cation:proton antiporter-2 (CPA2) family protein [Lysobacter solisilvae (ex Woo and Kim 2020)]|uniref:Cation:proton antiporter n=1 Tax=Agrilutibacter terrestris TaxID=2865112 RepID=A0A7H0FU59_9GAMM|nr:monovalent cation:proton antiporter-2 (CPA2) family protein [Lysobacter terrestris]QNP39575.1 cation:proton antiporter [Lysobacter terrestris]
MHGDGLELPLVFLLAAVIAVPVFRRFGLGAVLGYLAAGVVLGPHVLGVVRDADRVLTASEIGVVMMLFVIGLELSPSRLRVMRKPVFGAGGAQVVLSGIALACAAMFGASLLGDATLGSAFEWKAALVAGLGLALSSTAVGLQLLSERKALASEHGRLAFAILLFQDLAAIPLLASIPLLGHAHAQGSEPISLAVLKAVVAIAVVGLGGRVVLRHLFRVVARTQMPEVFTGAALLTVLGAAWVMQLAGLSSGLGAFLAGVLLADSEFRHELESQIDPFKGLLLGLFFMAVGMSIDVQRVLAEPLLIAAIVAGFMGIKFLLLLAVGVRPGGLGRRESLQLAAVLAAGGEFAFVVFGEAVKAGVFDNALRDRLVAAVGLSMALTPVLVIAVSRLLVAHPVAKPKRAFDAIPDGHPQVLIAGFGRFGQIVARLLAANRTPFLVIENDIEQVAFSRRFGNQIYYGDPAKPELLRSAGAAGVKVFVVAIDNQEANLRTVEVVRRLYPDAVVFARARDRRHAWELMDLGARIMRETFHSSLKLGEQVLVELGVPAETARHHAQRFHDHDERLLLAQYQVRDDEDALKQTVQEARLELEELLNADAGEGVLGDIVATRPPREGGGA